MSTVAKQLAQGHGYSAVIFDKAYPFEKGITTGPAIILPAALMIALLGNSYWVTGVTGIIIIDSLLLLLFLLAKPLFKHPLQRWCSGGLFLLLSMCITPHDMGAPGDKFHLWHTLMADIPCALLIIMAAIYLSLYRVKPGQLLTGGLIAGIALACKFQAFIGAGMLGVYVILDTGFTPRQRAKNLLLYVVGTVTPLACFQILKIILLGGVAAYLANTHQFTTAAHELIALASPAAIIKKIATLAEFLGLLHMTLSPESSPAAAKIFWFFLFAATVFCVAIAYDCARFFIRDKTHPLHPADWAGKALILCSAAHIGWWIFFCTTIFPRYAIEGLLYGCAALVLLAHSPVGEPDSMFVRRTVLLALAVLCLRFDTVVYAVSDQGDSRALKEQLEVLRTLRGIQHEAPDTVIFSCGFAFEMEYLMPGSRNFVPCERIREKDFALKNKILLTYSIDNSGKVLHSKKDSKWFFEETYNSPDAVALCPHNDLYAKDHYFLASCHPI